LHEGGLAGRGRLCCGPGELGFVRVTTEAGRESYAGSERNAIKSAAYGKWDGSFRLDRVAK